MAVESSGNAESSGDAESSGNSELELIELERARIGHEIHDALLPLVFAASASLRGLLDQQTPVDPDHRKRLVQVADWLDDALQVGRKLLVEVYPPELEGRDWDRAVKETLSRIVDADCEIDWQIDLNVNSQPAKRLSAGYRIVVEAVRNAIRHGGATKIGIAATQQNDVWSITVSDNGRGFEASEMQADRFGVRSMIGRAKLAGGSCAVNSTIGGPTTVRFQWTL